MTPQPQKFESFVNSERCKTYNSQIEAYRGLRALLIQKDVKLKIDDTTTVEV